MKRPRAIPFRPFAPHIRVKTPIGYGQRIPLVFGDATRIDGQKLGPIILSIVCLFCSYLYICISIFLFVFLYFFVLFPRSEHNPPVVTNSPPRSTLYSSINLNAHHQTTLAAHHQTFISSRTCFAVVIHANHEHCALVF